MVIYWPWAGESYKICAEALPAEGRVSYPLSHPTHPTPLHKHSAAADPRVCYWWPFPVFNFEHCKHTGMGRDHQSFWKRKWLKYWTLHWLPPVACKAFLSLPWWNRVSAGVLQSVGLSTTLPPPPWFTPCIKSGSLAPQWCIFFPEC